MLPYKVMLYTVVKEIFKLMATHALYCIVLYNAYPNFTLMSVPTMIRHAMNWWLSLFSVSAA